MPYQLNEILFLLSGFVASVMSASVGFGSSLILLPLAALLLPVKKAIAIVVIFFIVNNLTKVIVFYRHINWKIALLQWVLGLPLVIVGALFMVNISTDIIEKVLGIITVAFVISQFLRLSEKFELNNIQIAIFGGINGFLGGLIGAASVIRAAVFTHIKLKKEAFVATLAISGLLIDSVKTIIYSRFELITLNDLPLVVGLMVLAFIGTMIGKEVLKKINPKLFWRIDIIVILIIGLSLIF